MTPTDDRSRHPPRIKPYAELILNERGHKKRFIANEAYLSLSEHEAIVVKLNKEIKRLESSVHGGYEWTKKELEKSATRVREREAEAWDEAGKLADGWLGSKFRTKFGDCFREKAKAAREVK